MSSQKLIEIIPGKGLDSGLIPAMQPTAGAIWRDGANAWFRPMVIEHALGRQKLITTSQRARAMSRAFTQAGADRLYYEDSNVVRYLENNVSTVIGTLSEGSPDFVTWGDWLIATDDVNPIQIWKNVGSLATLTDAATQFTKAKILKKMAQHVLVFNTAGGANASSTSVHWCSANDPDTWTGTATNSARNTIIRNLDSEIKAVEPIGGMLGMYSENSMIPLRYLGPSQWFGTPNQALIGIGAAGKRAIVPRGAYNFGISRAGVFQTDGGSFGYIDRPYIDTWLQENVDWAKSEQIAGYWDERLQCIVWSVPVLDPPNTKKGLTLDPRIQGGEKAFSFCDADFLYAMERDVFDSPIIGLKDGIYLASVTGTLLGNFNVSSHLFDAGDASIYKSWDSMIIRGTIDPTSQVRFGFTDQPSLTSVEWYPWQFIDNSNVYFGPRESIYLAMELKSSGMFKCNSIVVMGEQGGFVNA